MHSFTLRTAFRLVILGLVFTFALVPPARAQYFETRGNFPVLEAPQWIAVGDFDHDGKLDLAVASLLADSEISVLLGNGDGTFRPAQHFKVGDSPYAIVAADFNRDGNLDLAVSNSADSNISVLLGNGDGTFQPAANFPTSANPKALQVADLNGDRDPDLITLETDGAACPCVSVLLGNGDGTFRLPVDTILASNAAAMAVGDFNRDGKIDVVTGGQAGESELDVLLGNGDGSFHLAGRMNIGANPESIAAADFNSDGNLDLAVAEFEGVAVAIYLGRGDGTFAPAGSYITSFPVWVTAGDFNGDGKPDLAVANFDFPPQVTIFQGNGKGLFELSSRYSAGQEPQFVAVGDFNGDRKQDLAVADFLGNSIGVLLNTGVVQFSPSDRINFAPQLVNTTSAPLAVQLTNQGTQPLRISFIKIQGPFAATSSCGKGLPAGASCSLDIVFKPASIGAKDGMITLFDSASSKPQVVTLTGQGTVVGLAPAQLSFPDQEVGTKSDPMLVTLTNHGSNVLTVTTIQLAGNNPRDFSQTNTCSRHILPGGQCSISITFAPTRTGARNATLGVSDDGGGSPQLVTLSGTGT